MLSGGVVLFRVVQKIGVRWGWFGLVRIIIDRVVVTWFETGTNLEFRSDQKLQF